MYYTSLKECAITFGNKDGWWLNYIGSNGKYRKGNEAWSQYAEHLNHFLLANCFKGEKKKDVLLTVIGLQTYKLLKSLVAPAKPDGKDYTQLV